MQVFTFEKIARSEKSSRRYLAESCRRVCAPRCPLCGADRIYTIEGGKRRRCSRCNRSFHPFARTWLNEVKISSRQWLWAVKLFELEMSAVTASKEIGISYPTVIKAFDVIRGAIAGSPFGVSPSTHGAVAGTDEVVISCSVDRRSAARTLKTIHAEKIKCIIELRRGCAICADGDVTCGLLIYRNRELRLVHRGERFPRFRIYFEGMEGFWPYAKEHFAKYHGISDEKLPHYMKEMEFRYDNRDKQLFDLLVDKLCRPMPRSAGDSPTRGDLVLQSP